MKRRYLVSCREASTDLARRAIRSAKRDPAPERRELSMRIGESLLLLALTAGLAVLALSGSRHEGQPIDSNTLYEDVDAWFV